MQNGLPENWMNYTHPEQPWCLHIPVSPTKTLMVWFSDCFYTTVNVDGFYTLLSDISSVLAGYPSRRTAYIRTIRLWDRSEDLPDNHGVSTKLYPLETAE